MSNFISKQISKIANSVSQTSQKVESFVDSTDEMKRLCRLANTEGIVMLKNDGVLPLGEKNIISVFGRVQRDYFFVGYGSGGDVNPPYKVSLFDALTHCEKLRINSELAEIYADWIEKNPVDDGWWGHWPMSYEEMPVSSDLAESMSKISDTALIVIGRSAGEDRESTLKEGSYFLTETERDILNNVTSHFKRVVVLLNCGSIMDMSWVPLYGDRISSILYVWQGGMESGNGICDILSGDASPSGKLTDTIAKSYGSYPSSSNFGNKKFNNYQEDIYVDYRFFETFGKESVLYPFGYGLSYADFEIELTRLMHRDNSFNLLVDVKNTSTVFSGKETVQVYIKPPQGQLGKEARRLVAFCKSGLLSPGEKQRLRISFSEYDMASFDDSGKSGHKNCYVLEKGEYEIYIGSDVRSAVMQRSITIGKTKVLIEHSEISSPTEKFERLVPILKGGKLVPMTEPVPMSTVDLRKRIISNLPDSIPQTGDKGIKLIDVKAGKRSLDEFVAQLSFDELEAISRGDYVMNSPLGASGNAGVLGGVLESLRIKGIPPVTTTDGPSGIRLRSTCSLLPNGVMLASTFNTELIYALYKELGKEMKDRGSDVLLAPGINIHRNPLCGRNFEYFSADPLLTGKIAASLIGGLQSSGVSACPKHYACNNQETNRTHNDSRVSQRALREIYLKGFEIALKEGKPNNIMTSYNKINGVWGHYNYDLCTVVLRKEWKYKGCVMTDWWMRKSHSPEFPNIHDQGYRIRSGVNILMPRGERVTNRKPDGTVKKSMKGKDGLTLAELQQNAKMIIESILQYK